MATFRTLPSGNVQAIIRRTGERQQSATFKSREQAERWVEEQNFHALNQGEIETLPQLGQRFIYIGLKGKKTQQETVLHLARVVEQLEALGIPLRLTEITRQHMNQYRLYRLQEVANATCRKDMQLIGRIYKWGIREYLYDHLQNPIEGINIPPTGKPRNRVVEREELDLILGEISTIMRPIVELAFETAMRRGEIVKLTPGNLHLEERYLEVIDAKCGDRLCPLSTRAVEILRECSKGKGEDQKIFPVEPHSVSTAFRRATDRLGMKGLCLHNLRHTRISLEARKGMPLMILKQVSGHASLQSLERYSHIDVQSAIQFLD